MFDYEIINLLKWFLISLNLTVNSTLLWKIWKRKNLHTIFNLGMCLYFFLGGSLSPLLIYDYSNLLQEMMEDPDTTHPDICIRIFRFRVVLTQALKIILISIVFR